MKCRHGPSLQPAPGPGIHRVWICSRCGSPFTWGAASMYEGIPECPGCERQIVTRVLCGLCSEDDLPTFPEVLRLEARPAPAAAAPPTGPWHTLVRLADDVLAWEYRWRNERDLQDGLEVVLREARWQPKLRREVRLNHADRIDFVIGDLGVEVKVDGSLATVTRQLHRYAQVEELAGVLLVTTRAAHLAVPRELNGKPIVVARLIGGIS